ncbi:MAG: hypothetical protein ACPGWR_20765 [Ardenticatenaceae bacterium]
MGGNEGEWGEMGGNGGASRVLQVATNTHKDLDFLSQNRLIFMLQQNIVRCAQGFDYERWFRFAEKSRNRENMPEDFEEFEGDEIFEEMMKRLNQSMLTEEDYEYIEHEQEMWEEVARLEQEYYEEGRKEGEKEGRREGKKEGRREGEKGEAPQKTQPAPPRASVARDQGRCAIAMGCQVP